MITPMAYCARTKARDSMTQSLHAMLRSVEGDTEASGGDGYMRPDIARARFSARSASSCATYARQSTFLRVNSELSDLNLPRIARVLRAGEVEDLTVRIAVFALADAAARGAYAAVKHCAIRFHFRRRLLHVINQKPEMM